MPSSHGLGRPACASSLVVQAIGGLNGGVIAGCRTRSSVLSGLLIGAEFLRVAAASRVCAKRRLGRAALDAADASWTLDRREDGPVRATGFAERSEPADPSQLRPGRRVRAAGPQARARRGKRRRGAA